MTKIEFPIQLVNLLEGSTLAAPIRLIADRIGEIVADNKLPFFPDYTDHGTEHINRVLKSMMKLVPNDVWEHSEKDSNPRLLNDIDAAIIIGAALLHDIAMHLHPKGFFELVSRDSRFKPVEWFDKDQELHHADRLWWELWDEYQREARRLSDRRLADIIGIDSVREGWTFQKLPENIGEWQRNHFLIIGEFIRRHHARLAHEIALYGFPGLEADEKTHQFSAMGEAGHPLRDYADLIGLAARSHGTSLRVCMAYLKVHDEYENSPRPLNAAALYPMTLLRIADYLQIDKTRAPAVLLQLRDPQSPISVREWQKQLAIKSITPGNDPQTKKITVNNNVSLELFLQIRELIEGLQRELDHSIAVLGEAYGRYDQEGLNRLNLTVRRVTSNIDNPTFRQKLPYVPERTGFSTDPNLLSLLVEPLYGNYPEVGVRELMQNGIDAVRELHVWCERHGKDISSLDLPKQNADVLIDFIELEDGSWLLQVTDKGIGMTVDTLQNYFLRAGASFRQSPDWASEYLDDEGKPRVLRSGRFGIGAFATFLLGDTFTVKTRHVSENNGHQLTASKDSQLIETRRAENLSIGTSIEIKLSHNAIKALGLPAYGDKKSYKTTKKTNWYYLQWPSVLRTITSRGKSETLFQKYCFEQNERQHNPEWFPIRWKGLDAVYWTFSKAPDLICNGIKIISPNMSIRNSIDWNRDHDLSCPKVAVYDSEGNLPLTTQRYSLLEYKLPFEAELYRDTVFSFIAHALVCGPRSPSEVFDATHCHPLDFENSYKRSNSAKVNYQFKKNLRWCVSKKGIVPSIPKLYPLLKTRKCIFFGMRSKAPIYPKIMPKILYMSLAIQAQTDTAIICGSLCLSASRNMLQKLTHQLEEATQPLGQQSDGFCCAILTSRKSLLYDDTWVKSQTPHIQQREVHVKHHTKSESDIPSHSLEQSLLQMEKNLVKENIFLPALLFCAEIHYSPMPDPLETLESQIWFECLGERIIPFDSEERKALIEHGRKHPDLRRHIEAWEELKRINYPWKRA